jgi:hypothetical protein
MKVEREALQFQDRFLPLPHRLKAAQYPDTQEKIANSPIANYSERNLFEFARTAGFTDIHLELHIDLLPSIIRSWDLFLRTSPHPWAPPAGPHPCGAIHARRASILRANHASDH